ncbi:MAG: hypothetical protein KatS3mg131_0075 [Candidatus Tectimicrobiota bacterium]|nr:MAG: hypothetical protein KatS3mg131_0075 [Candidatus Tectomicrobia bacterium]
MERVFKWLLVGLLFLLPQPALSDRGMAHRVRQDRPIALGTSGGNVNDRSQQFCCSGTLGALIDANGTLEILSNNHVLAISNNGVIGDDVNQPGNIDVGCQVISGDFVAKLSQFEPISFTADNLMDAATAAIIPGTVRTDGAILDIGPPGSVPVEPALGMPVKKSGRTTGLTRGRIVALNVTVNVMYPEECGDDSGQTARFVEQIRIRSRPCSPFRRFRRRFSKPGDSGSLVVEDRDSCPPPVGLLFAGGFCDTIANPIDAVLAAFNATLVGCEAPATATEAPLRREWSMRDPRVAAAAAVQRRHTEALMRLPGVVGTGIGLSEETGQVVIEVYVERATAALQRALPRRLEGLPVQVVETGTIVAQRCAVPLQGGSREP